MNSSEIGPATVSLTQTVACFFTFLPGFPHVRTSTPGDETSKDVRSGEFAASIIAIGVGGIITALTKNSTPLLVSVITAGMLVLVYEVRLRRPA